ncbi:MAG: tetratricopeptide repeat protein [Bacteroidota bacterium]|nr:tetratricopeptide repeat protein [Bacteroidota bacterium]
MATTQSTALPDFNTMWNFANPAETEHKFLAILPQAEAARDTSYLIQLLTQIARTHSLRANFGEAHAILDRAEQMLASDLKLARVRYLLERGRTFNSDAQAERALPLFMEAYELASSIGEMSFAADAIHMLAIAKQDPKEQIEWNLKGIALANSHSSARRWLHALYNNIGESYLRTKEYDTAAMYFNKLLDLQRENDGKPDIYTLKDAAKAIRLAGRPKEALAILEPVIQELQVNNEDNGWIRDEMGESLLALGDQLKAKPHFLKAYELLSKDQYCTKYEPEKLVRLKKMSE